MILPGVPYLNISIIVVALNEAKTIPQCLDSLLRLDYPYGELEIVVVDGCSTDSTRDIVREYIEKDPRIRLVVEEKKGTSAARNAGFFAARYDFVAYTDADCVVPRQWIRILHDAFVEERQRDPRVAAVGGAAQTDEAVSGKFVKALEFTLNSSIGSFRFSTTGKSYFKRREVKDIPTLNILMDREMVKDVGAFDETLRSEAEDAELCYKLVKDGYKLISIPESYVIHKYRSGPGTWWKNMKRYGRGRMRLMKRYPDMINIYYIAPIIFFLSLIASPVLFSISLFYFQWPIWVTLFFALPLMYFPLVALFSLFICSVNKRKDLFREVLVAFVLTHIGYSLGELQGLFLSKEDGGLSDKTGRT